MNSPAWCIPVPPQREGKVPFVVFYCILSSFLNKQCWPIPQSNSGSRTLPFCQNCPHTSNPSCLEVNRKTGIGPDDFSMRCFRSKPHCCSLPVYGVCLQMLPASGSRTLLQASKCSLLKSGSCRWKKWGQIGQDCNKLSCQSPILVAGTWKERILILIQGDKLRLQETLLSLSPYWWLLISCHALVNLLELPWQPTWTIDFLLFWNYLQPSGLPGFRASFTQSSVFTISPGSHSGPLIVTTCTPKWQRPPQKRMAWHY